MSRIVIDTGMFLRPAALAEARAGRRRVVVPAVAYAERLRQVARRGTREAARFSSSARGMVEPLTPREVEAIMPHLAELDRGVWHRLARDALIAGHVRPGDELWTTNPADFVAVGVPEDRIVAW